jgi:TonB family protein
MKTRLLLFAAVAFFTACSLFGGPTATVRKFMDQAKAADAKAMTELFSRRAIQREGIEKINQNNQTFAELMKKAAARSSYNMNNIKESTSGVNARVAFHYQSADRKDSIRLVFALTKEDGQWKIDNIGGSELESIADLGSPDLKDPRVKKQPSPEATPPPPSENGASSTSANKTISGGVLNEKAVSLPKPEYPPSGKSVKASGRVVVEVVVDENGQVASAIAVSGHPLLRSAAVVAARAAKFPPPRDAGQPVKMKGVINYDFEAE